MEAAPPTPILTAVNTTAPPGVTPRVDALLRLGQAALELASTGDHVVDLTIHGVPRAAFNAFPGERRDGTGFTCKIVNLDQDDDGVITLRLFTNEPEPDPEPDWFAVAQRITGVRP